MDVNQWNDGLAKWGGHKPPGELECSLCETAALAPFKGRSTVPIGELDRVLLPFREVVVITTKLKLRIVAHSDGFYFRGQQ